MLKTRLDRDRIFVIHDFLSAEECSSLIARSERADYEEATITTSEGFVLDKDIRNNARLITDDTGLAGEWWQRARPFVPPAIGRANAVGLNERFRFYRYDPGQKFAPHFDGPFDRSVSECSQLTFMVYLNADFTGGETNFFRDDGELRVTVRPASGMALVFAHAQLHEGAAVQTGRKYVLRTDVMYSLAPPAVSSAS